MAKDPKLYIRKNSKIHANGLFAKYDIEPGAMKWAYDFVIIKPTFGKSTLHVCAHVIDRIESSVYVSQ